MLKSIDIPLLILISSINNMDRWMLGKETSKHSSVWLVRDRDREAQTRTDEFYKDYDLDAHESVFSDYEDLLRLNYQIDTVSWSMSNLGKIMKVSASTIHDSVKRMLAVQLLVTSSRSESKYEVDIESLRNLIIHSIKYIAPVKLGSLS